MSAKSKDKLAELIHSMTRSEKRYFKLFAQRHTIGESNKYVDLFDEIDSILPYDEAYIFKKFKGDPMINNFNVTKKRLYDHIIRALNQFYSESSITSQLNEFLNTIETLFKKGLYTQAAKKINVAKKIANQHDQLSYYLIFLKWEAKLKSTQPDLSNKASNKEIFEEEIEVVKNIQDQQKLQHIKDRLVQIQRALTFEAENTEIDEIEKEILDISKKDHLSLQLELDIKSTLALVYFIKNDTQKAIQLLTEKLDILNQNKNRIRRAPSEFMSDLANLIHLECSNGLYSSAHEHLSILKSFPKKFKIRKTQNFDIRFFATQQSLELSYNMYRYDFEKIIALEENIKAKLNDYDDHFPQARKTYFHYMLAIAHFYRGNIKKALQYSNTIANEVKNPSSSIIAIYNKWLQIFIHFELKNYDLVQYKLAAARKFLKKNAEFNPADNEIILTLSKINDQLSEVEINEILEQHLSKLEATDEKQLMSFSRSFFDYRAWIMAKTYGSPITEQLKRA